MVERYRLTGYDYGTEPHSEGAWVTHHAYADLERQIAELRAEVDVQRQSKEFAQRCCDKAEAENARLRALPLKDEVERVLASVKTFHDRDEGLNVFTANYEILREEIDALLSRLRAGEQEGMRWRPMDSAPKDGTEILARCGMEFPAFSCFWDGAAFVHYDHEEGLIAYPATEWTPLGPQHVSGPYNLKAGSTVTFGERGVTIDPPAAPSGQGGDRG